MDCVSLWERVAGRCRHLGGDSSRDKKRTCRQNLYRRPVPNIIVMNRCRSCALYGRPRTHPGDSLPLRVALTSRHGSRLPGALATFLRRPNGPRGSGRAPPFLPYDCSHPYLISSLATPRLLPQEMEISVNSGDSSLTHRAGLCHINFANVSMLSATYSSDEE